MAGDFENKIALITGSGRGMGLVDALLMAEQGATIVIHDIDPALAADATEKVRAKGGEVFTLVSDISDRAETQAKIREAEARFGRIDILVNNAGIGLGGKLEDVSEESFDRTMDVHVKGSFFATQAVIPGMKARRSGAIVNISSIWGMTGHDSDSPYCGAKAALLGLTKAWAKEFAPWNIRVNVVAPGCVLTDMTIVKGQAYIDDRAKLIPLGRWAQPEEMCQAVVYLASEKASFITGQCISPNGGDTIVGI
jgi:3-oxoacyl-[acyl-carrier protein] reductase